MGFTVENIPAYTPYLKAPRTEQTIKAPSGNLEVGLAWAGSHTHSDDANRSIPLAILAPVLAASGVSFYSLQMPVPQRDMAALKDFPNLVQLGPFRDYLATASVVAELDLVISVDTSVAHLAGAIGKPAWNMIQFAPDWRWFAQFGDKTPWYPTMQLFRQPRRGDWLPVISRVAEELSLHAARTTLS